MKKKLLTLTIVLVSFLTASSQSCLVNPPSKFKPSGISSCGFTMSWMPAGGASYYTVKYKINGSGGNTTVLNTGLNTTVDISGLEPATKYKVMLQAHCTDGSVSNFINKKVTTHECALPQSVSVSQTISEATLHVTALCPFDTLYYRYGKTGTTLSQFTTITDSALLTGLTPKTSYVYQVSVCPLSQNNWTSTDTFLFQGSLPNILLILLDDSRFDFYSCNGAPSFFQTPAIDRIANEGVNFKQMFSVISLCAPSRASIATGLYPSRHHVIDNVTQDSLDHSLPMLPQLLHQNGYYTALVGKNHDIYNYGDGYFDYWLETTLDYKDNAKKYIYGNKNVYIAGYPVTVLTDSVVGLINRQHTPYFILFAHNATHEPEFPDIGYEHLYDNDIMPLGPDTARFTINYPSFIDKIAPSYMATPSQAWDLFHDTYEVMKSVDDNLLRVLDALEATNQLDNTLVIFTSDNGILYGEHGIDSKRFMYDPSLRVPLFMRYPAWFTPGTKVTDQVALNIDLTKTILEAAGISTDGLIMDGVSLRKLYNHEVTRKEFYYHYYYSEEKSWKNFPYIYGIRDLRYKYTTYGCNDSTEEFFDLKNDSLEMNNLINKTSYAMLIQQYRNKLPYYLQLYNDTLYQGQLNCKLNNPVYTRVQMEDDPGNWIIFPNPNNGIFNVAGAGFPVKVLVLNSLGQVVYTSGINNNPSIIELPQLSPGLYDVILYENTKVSQRKMVVK